MAKEKELEKNNKYDIEELRRQSSEEAIAVFLGMRLEKLEPGYACVTMTVRPEHINFHGTLFGGITMSLADQAFAYAVNAARSPSVASQVNIHYLIAAGLGDTLTAQCRLVHDGRRAGVSEFTVTNQAGKIIARGTATSVPVGRR